MHAWQRRVCHACMAKEGLSCMLGKEGFVMHAWQRRVFGVCESISIVRFLVRLKARLRMPFWFYQFLAPAVTVGETEGAMDSASVFFAFSFAYNFVRK